MTAERRRALIVVISVLVVIVATVAIVRGNSPPRPTAAPTTAGPVPTSPTSPTSPTGDAPPVIVPGRPGETAATRDAREVREGGLPRYNTVDTWFVRMMIPHHTQALRMAALAPDRAADPRVRAVAERIRVSQTPEIQVMRAWLDARRLGLDEQGHDHATMRGMQSPAALDRLAAARGADFDRLFVSMMSDHHRGAVEMATNVLKAGTDLAIEELATSVAAEQAVEIDRMRQLTGA